MRLQHISVLFVIIFIPIFIVISYFISLQVNTIKLEASYDEKLLNATYDAMTAFELNTANEDLSSVSDSLRSIIDASNNLFFNTLCTNLGFSNASKSYIQPYIPAILYTLYDGYYIYAPTNVPEICVDKFGRTIRTSDYGVTYLETQPGTGVGIYQFDKDSIVYSQFTPTVPAENPAAEGDNLQTAPKVDYNALPNKEEYGQILYKNNNGTYSTALHSWGGAKTSATYQKSTYYKRDYILKSYIPYSARYNNGSDINIVINYTLDNFMTIEGYIGNIYYTKSGYFIDKDLIQTITVDGATITDWTMYSEEILDTYIYDSGNHTVVVVLSDGTIISNRDGAVSVTAADGVGIETKYWEDAQSAVEYYINSYIFSCWIHANLNNLQALHLQKIEYSVANIQDISSTTKSVTSETELYKNILFNFDGDNTKPFDGNGNDPESEESNFYKHKRNVIKNSIIYNLILSMVNYTEESRTLEFNMPVFQEYEWDRILNNVSITTFMEGMKCGLKYYNNYAIVTSTNNEISVSENEIYYVPRADRKDDADRWILNNIEDLSYVQTAHRIDCDELELNANGAISFKSKEIKYDKILRKDGKFEYDHMVYTDYDCIVDSNYTVTGAVTGKVYDGNTKILNYLLENRTDAQTLQKLQAYRIAIAKERNNLYKTTRFAENYGWQVIYLGDSGQASAGDGTVTVSMSGLSRTDIKEIKKIEITIDQVNQTTAGIYSTNVLVNYSSGATYAQSQTVATTSSSRKTLEYIQDFPSASASSLTIKFNDPDTNLPGASFVVRAVKFYYK